MKNIIYSFSMLLLLSSFSPLNGMTPPKTALMIKLEEKQKQIEEIERQIKIAEINSKAHQEFDTFEDFLQNVKETTEQLKEVLRPRPSTPPNNPEANIQ